MDFLFSSTQENKPRVAFTDFWLSFNLQDNIFQEVLTSHLGVDVVDDAAEADVLIYSIHGDSQKEFKGTKVFYTGESVTA